MLEFKDFQYLLLLTIGYVKQVNTRWRRQGNVWVEQCL